MTTFHGKRCILMLFFVFLTVFGALCTASSKTTAEIEAEWQSMQPIRAKLVLLMPQEFAGYVFIYSHKGEELQLPLGQQALDHLKILLESAFTSMDVISVPSKSAAMDMISRKDPELLRYDLVAVPKFEEVTYWDQGPEYGFNVDMSLEVSSFSSRMIDTIHGRSTASTAVGGFSPIERITLAVSYALDAIKGVIESKRYDWSK